MDISSLAAQSAAASRSQAPAQYGPQRNLQSGQGDGAAAHEDHSNLSWRIERAPGLAFVYLEVDETTGETTQRWPIVGHREKSGDPVRGGIVDLVA